MTWRSIKDDPPPKDGRRLLLSVEIDGRARVHIGGYDPHWTGQCWVYETPRVTVGTEPLKWQPLPDG